MTSSWPPPRTPLSPHRLAKLANAFGVPTPVPGTVPRCSPQSPSSPFLLHVLPCPPLPCPPILVPVYSSFHALLSAIAREYTFPSTLGLVISLVTDNDPPPRLSQLTWRHIWARVVQPRLSSSDLPSPNSIPILAKLKLDIDPHIALWYQPWLRSHHHHHHHHHHHYKKVGTVCDDLDIDFHDDDPNDQRHSQFLFKAKLDEIERTMAQLSPRVLDADLQSSPSQVLSSNKHSSSSHPVSSPSHPSPVPHPEPLPTNSSPTQSQVPSPDLLARFSPDPTPPLSSSSSQLGESSSLNTPSMALVPVVEDEGSPPSPSPSPTVSRFSADSITITSTEAAKPSVKSTLMTVRSIKRLWRKSNKSSNSLNTPSHHQVPPVRPERPFEETIDLPDVQLDPPPLAYSSFLAPSGPSSTQDRPFYDQLNVPQSNQIRHLSPFSSLGTYPVTQNHSSSRKEPTFPIVAAQLLPRGTPVASRFQFDQESPYPVHMSNSSSPSPAYIPLPPSPAIPATLPVHLQPSSLEKDKLTGPKSILKAFSKSKQIPVLPPTMTQSRLSVDKSSHQGFSARPSFHSVKSSLTEIPFSGGRLKTGPTSIPNHGDRIQLESRSTTCSTDSAMSISHKVPSGSPHLSMGSSRSSIETRPSSEMSQFEFVSSKTSTLTYPYHHLS